MSTLSDERREVVLLVDLADVYFEVPPCVGLDDTIRLPAVDLDGGGDD